MGTPKDAVLVGGRSFFDRVRQAAASVFDSVVAVTWAEGAETAAAATLHDLGAEERAPIFGVARALQHSRSERIFVLAVDYPLVTPELLSYLAARFESSRADILVPRALGHLHVLCAGYSKSLQQVVERKVQRGDYGLRRLTGEVATEIVGEDELQRFEPERTLANVNTPEELEVIRRIYERGEAADAPR